MVPPDTSDVGVHPSAVTVTGGVRLNDAVCLLPFTVAVTPTVCAAATLAAEAVKAPVVDAAATTT